MKRNIVVLLLFIVSLSISAQTAIKGTVIDKDTNTPISDVLVQYGASSKDYVFTDGKGYFSIPEGSEDIIHFQCIGYKTMSIPKSEVKESAKVVMELNPISLNPIVISPVDADKLLEEVMINTKKKLLTDIPIGYLLHFLQTKNTDTLQNEIYLKYATSLTAKELKKNLNKERVPYTYNIIDIRKIQENFTPTSELYGAEYHASHLFTFGKSINNETSRSYTSDSSLIILQIEPLAGKGGWAKGEINIRKDDMTILSMEIESIDSILATQPYKRYMGSMLKILRKVGRFEFDKVDNKYYLKKCYTYYKFRVVDASGIEEDVSYFCDVKCVGYIEKIKMRKRQLSGYCQELFYFPDSSDKKFWLESNPMDLDSFEDRTNSLSDGFAPSKRKERIKWGNVLLPLPLIGLLLLL